MLIYQIHIINGLCAGILYFCIYTLYITSVCIIDIHSKYWSLSFLLFLMPSLRYTASCFFLFQFWFTPIFLVKCFHWKESYQSTWKFSHEFVRSVFLVYGHIFISTSLASFRVVKELQLESLLGFEENKMLNIHF